MLIGLTTLPIALRRLYPVPVFTVVVAAWIADRLLDYPTTLSFLGVVLAFHSVGTELPRRQSLLIGGGTAAFITVFTAVGAATLESIPAAAATTLITTLVPLLLGREVHERRLRIEDLEVRAGARRAGTAGARPARSHRGTRAHRASCTTWSPTR